MTQWREYVARWKSSGLSLRDYAATAGLNGVTMRTWVRKFESEQSSTSNTRAGFVERRAPAVSPVNERLEVVLRNGVVVRVPTLVDAGSLRQFIALVEVC